MKRSLNLSLGQTVALATTGGLLMASTFPLMAVFHLNYHNGTLSLLVRLILSFSPIILGLVLSAKAVGHIKDGIANERWPAEEIATFRGIFESILWRAFLGILLIGCCIAFAVASHRSSLSWFLIVLLQSLNSLTTSFMKRRQVAPPPDDWRSRPPLQSQHWGQR